MDEALLAVTKVGVLTFVVAGMAATGLQLTLASILRQLRDVRLVIGLLLANFVVVPAIAVAFVRVFPVEEAAGTAVTLLACCAGAPFLPTLARLAKGDAALAVGGMVLLMVLTVAYAPLVVPAVVQGATVSAWDIAGSLIVLMLIPLAVGLLVRARYADPGRLVAGAGRTHRVSGSGDRRRGRSAGELARSAQLGRVVDPRRHRRRVGCGPRHGLLRRPRKVAGRPDRTGAGHRATQHLRRPGDRGDAQSPTWRSGPWWRHCWCRSCSSRWRERSASVGPSASQPRRGVDLVNGGTASGRSAARPCRHSGGGRARARPIFTSAASRPASSHGSSNASGGHHESGRRGCVAPAGPGGRRRRLARVVAGGRATMRTAGRDGTDTSASTSATSAQSTEATVDQDVTSIRFPVEPHLVGGQPGADQVGDRDQADDAQGDAHEPGRALVGRDRVRGEERREGAGEHRGCRGEHLGAARRRPRSSRARTRRAGFRPAPDRA